MSSGTFWRIFFWEDWSPNKFGTITDICLAFRGVFFDSVVKTEIYDSMRKLYELKIFPKSIQFRKCVRIRSKNFGKCLQKVSGEAVKTAFNVPKRLRLAKFYFFKIFFRPISSGIFSESRWKFLVDKSAF